VLSTRTAKTALSQEKFPFLLAALDGQGAARISETARGTQHRAVLVLHGGADHNEGPQLEEVTGGMKRRLVREEFIHFGAGNGCAVRGFC
jgi:hypothetical protein